MMCIVDFILVWKSTSVLLYCSRLMGMVAELPWTCTIWFMICKDWFSNGFGLTTFFNASSFGTKLERGCIPSRPSVAKQMPLLSHKILNFGFKQPLLVSCTKALSNSDSFEQFRPISKLWTQENTIAETFDSSQFYHCWKPVLDVICYKALEKIRHWDPDAPKK